MEKSLETYFKNQVIESDKSSAKTQAGSLRQLKKKKSMKKIGTV